MSAPFDPTADYYATLGVESGASADEIKKAYRRLAKQYHPDSTGGDKRKEAKFKEISSAYDVLGDTDKRREYDAFRAGPRMGPGFGAGFDGNAAGFGASGFGFDLGDLFSQVFRGGAPGQPGGPGGVRYSFYSSDGGAGDMFGGDHPRSGARRRRQRRKAPTRPSEEVIKAADGSAMTRRGKSVYSDVRVPLDQAILGAVVEVPTLTGKANVKIPPGTSSGAKLRLKGKGARGDNGTIGDHYVTVQIDVPKAVDEKSKKLLVEFMKRTQRAK